MNLQKRIKELEEEQRDMCCDIQEGAKLSEKADKRFVWVNNRLAYLYTKIYCVRCGGNLPCKGSPFVHVCPKEKENQQ